MFKNWSAINKIKDFHLRLALVLLDLTTEESQSIAAQLPDYFSETEMQGHIPLSAIRELAEKECRCERKGGHSDCLWSYNKYWGGKGQVGENIEVLSFSTEEDNGFDDPMLPKEIDGQILALGRRAEVGDVFTWEGKELVLIENNDDKRGSCFLMHFASKEQVDPTK